MKTEPSTVSGSETMKKTTDLDQQKSPDGSIPTRLTTNEDTVDTENSKTEDRTFSTLVRELETKHYRLKADTGRMGVFKP